MKKPRPTFRMLDRLTRLPRYSLGWAALVVGSPGCRCEPSPAVNPPIASPTQASPASPDTLSSRCRPVSQGRSFTIPALGKGVSEEEERLRPFAVELGAALRVGPGFAVTFTRGDGRQSQAGVAWLDASAGQGEVVDLTAIRGDGAPPRAAVSGDALVVAVMDNDAIGGALRLAKVSRGQPATWGAELDLGVDDSLAFELALSGQRGLLVWDEWDKSKNESYISLSGFDVGRIADAAAPVRVSPAKVDAESPRLSAAKHGFWLAWISFTPVGESRKTPKAGQQVDEFQDLVEIRASAIQIMRLDPEGRPIGEALRVTPVDGYVSGFDLTTGPDESALVVWRAAQSSPGIQGGVVSTTRLALDGSFEAKFIEDQDIGSGVPSFLFDSEPKVGAPNGWLVV
ncbi:MAG: hypothetical protein RJA70_3457, partial [Pseudomonadota bacterium]